MQKYVLIEVDCNDLDSISSKTPIIDEQILELKRILAKMPKQSRRNHEVIQYKTGELGDNNLENEISDYHYLTDEEKDFLHEFLPRTEYGFHTILDVVIIQEIENLLLDKYTYRLELLKSYGFVEKLGCITNGKYAFLYHQLDLSELTDEQFMEFINIVKSELE